MNRIEAREIKVGDRFSCDMGYGAHSRDELCEVVKVEYGKGLFENPLVYFEMKIINSKEKFDMAGVQPTDVFQVIVK